MKPVISSLALLLALAGTATADDNADPARNAYIATDDPLGEPVAKVVYLKQNWSPAQSLKFYFSPQGSRIIPYDWFLALEQADTQTPFRDTKNILRLRYLAQNPDPMWNPDGLPVGFTKDPGPTQNSLGMTCAACHTTEIRLGNTAYRVDGAPTQGDVQAFFNDLTVAMRKTADDPAKFDRFATQILQGNDSPENRTDLKNQLTASITERIGYNLRNFAGFDPNQAPAPPATGYARLDAVDAIMNEVFHHAVPAAQLTGPTRNTIKADAPVSYPCLWDTPQHDFVQWLGIAKNDDPLGLLALSRNVGEVLGVFGRFEIPEKGLFEPVGFRSSVNFANLMRMEESLKSLWSPLWPDDFPMIDQDAAAAGKTLYQANCVSCHQLIDRKSPLRTVTAWIGATGTDSRAYDNFFTQLRPSGKLQGQNINFVPFTPKIPENASSDTMLSHVVIGVLLGQTQPPPLDALNQISFRVPAFKLLETAPPPGAKYKTRPLNGIWATAPYLHNGSVPNLDALLQPAAKRPTSFSIGVRTFDPVRVGYLLDVPGFPKFNVLDANGAPIIGNSNAGHEFGASLSDNQKKQLIEYLKTL